MHCSIFWFRNDLRLEDNPALIAAAKQKQPLYFIYILEQNNLGEASRWWLHQSLKALNESLRQKYDAELNFFSGEPLKILAELSKKLSAQHIFASRVFEPTSLKHESALIQGLSSVGVQLNLFNCALLFEPWCCLNKSGTYFKVFTPFWRKLQTIPQRTVLKAPSELIVLENKRCSSLEDLNLLPKVNWYSKLLQYWSPGESAAKAKLALFIKNNLSHYRTQRDIPALDATSKLSPHLHFGEMSPVQIFSAIDNIKHKRPELAQDCDRFLAELAWREFSYHLLYYFPSLATHPFKADYAKFPWAPKSTYPATLAKWQQGLTGYPIVDAGMRELWETGYMHNRVRMIAASFLIKHLLIPWQEGEAWFWDTLVDADLANNAASWQWVAGSGADAAPYFRIFNPILQGQKFDPQGEYIKKWLPCLHLLDNKYIHCPWEAPDQILNNAKVVLGKTYPRPIVNHEQARRAALQAYKKLAEKLS